MNRNADVKQEIINALKLQTALGDDIKEPIPVIEVNPKLTKEVLNAHALLSNGTQGTILTASSTKDRYITSASLSFIKDAGNTSTFSDIRVTQKGKTTYILEAAHLTTTAQNGTLCMVFQHPIRIDPNTIVYVETAVGDANIRIAASITYYEEEIKSGS